MTHPRRSRTRHCALALTHVTPPAERSERPDESCGLPDAPRLRLDELLGQLVARAEEVLSAQDRLRGLLAANRMIIGDLALPVVLRRITEAACQLVHARYAALGV